MLHRKLFFARNLYLCVTEGYLSIASNVQERIVTLNAGELVTFVKRFVNQFDKSTFKVTIGCPTYESFIIKDEASEVNFCLGLCDHKVTQLELNFFLGSLARTIPHMLSCDRESFVGVAFLLQFVDFITKKTDQVAKQCLDALLGGNLDPTFDSFVTTFAPNLNQWKLEELTRFLLFHQSIARSCWLLRVLAKEGN
jgi:hypothetical protein